MIRRVIAWVVGVGWLAGWRLTRLVPERIAMTAFERMALRSHRRNERRRGIVATNLAPVVAPGVLDDTVHDAFRWYGRYWAETFRMQDLSRDELDKRFHVEGVEHIERAYASGKGAVLATPHLGNWDSGGRWVAERWPLTVVVEVLRPRMLFDRFVAHRRSLGMSIVPLERGADATARCLERLQKGELVALVADRDLSGSGIEVQMFDRRTKMPPGPAVLSLRTGAPVIPACIYQQASGSWRALVLPPLAPPEDPGAPDATAVLTQRLARAFESLIAPAPAQWHVFFSRYWLDGSAEE